MRGLGFDSWRRPTVAEVDGQGAGRRVTIHELLVLAELFGVGVGELLWPQTGRLEVTPKFTIDEQSRLWATLVNPVNLYELMQSLGKKMAIDLYASEFRRMYELMITQVGRVTKELQDTAGYLDDQLPRWLMEAAPKEEGS